MRRSRLIHELGLACHVGWAGNAQATPLCRESGGAAALQYITLSALSRHAHPSTLTTAVAIAIAASRGSALLAAVARRRMSL